jgi:hypothetical protein
LNSEIDTWIERGYFVVNQNITTTATTKIVITSNENNNTTVNQTAAATTACENYQNQPVRGGADKKME